LGWFSQPGEQGTRPHLPTRGKRGPAECQFATVRGPNRIHGRCETKGRTAEVCEKLSHNSRRIPHLSGALDFLSENPLHQAMTTIDLF